ncbi:MAG: hypothetical protein DPW18_09615 [Chloroflexi bacterium]|nr:hypothetical protein [Chloroflexota bacterium]MDL1941783.1 hypothetical protein [Chloroflexi bacterium CFX2]
MLKGLLILLLLFQDSPPALTSPQPNAVLRGQVEIQGRMDVPNFASAELAFTFDADASDPGASWFVIQTFPQPTAGPSLAVWDTASVTDGDYALRLRAFLQDGAFQDALITGLKIRNDEPPPTITPTQTEPVFDFQPLNQTPGAPAPLEQTPIPAVVFLPTSTPLPPNPASLTVASILSIFGKSAFAVLILFAFFSLLLRLQKN